VILTRLGVYDFTELTAIFTNVDWPAILAQPKHLVISKNLHFKSQSGIVNIILIFAAIALRPAMIFFLFSRFVSVFGFALL
jgi:hypothetical protein